MKRIQAQNYVIQHAGYQEQNPLNSAYTVRFPTPTSPRSFFASSPDELVNKLFNFGRTAEGRELWERIPKGEYMHLPDSFLEDEEEEYV